MSAGPPEVDGSGVPAAIGGVPLQATTAYLVNLHRAGARPQSLPPALAPRSEAEAYHLQQEVARALGQSIGGWKIALNSDGSGRTAPVFAAELRRSPAQLSSSIAERIGIEPEVAFSLGRDLPALPTGRRYTRAQVIDAIDAAHAAIEILISRFHSHEGAPPLHQLADNLSNGGLVVGPACRNWRSLDLPTLALELSIRKGDGTRSVVSVRGGHPLGDPLRPLLWMADHHSARGLSLRAGEFITTGSCAGLRYAGHGAQVSAEFAGLGRAELYCV